MLKIILVCSFILFAISNAFGISPAVPQSDQDQLIQVSDINIMISEEQGPRNIPRILYYSAGLVAGLETIYVTIGLFLCSPWLSRGAEDCNTSDYWIKKHPEAWIVINAPIAVLGITWATLKAYRYFNPQLYRVQTST